MTVSAVITTYNRPDMLKRALKSVLVQTYKDVDIIVVEDGSDSGIMEWVKAEGYDNVRYIRHSRNMGLAVARNTGLKEAKGDFIAYLDDDDEWKPGRIQYQVEALGQLSPFNKDNLGLIYCGSEIRFPGKKVVSIKHPKRTGSMRKIITRDGLSTMASSYLFSRKALESAGGFDENLTSCIDHDIWMSFAAKGYKAFAIDKPLVMVDDRTHRETMMTNTEKRIEGVTAYINKWMPTFKEWMGEDKGSIYGYKYYLRVLARLAANKLIAGKYGEFIKVVRSMYSFTNDVLYSMHVIVKFTCISFVDKFVPGVIVDNLRNLKKHLWHFLRPGTVPETIYVPKRYKHKKDLPRISIITPSYNQARYLEETILSVLNQNYPNLEYIIIDGGSSDGSVDIIKKYEKYITYWESVPDKGQADAINKGFNKSTGEVMAWLNSDDIYLNYNAISRVVEVFDDNEDKDLVVASGVNIYSKWKLRLPIRIPKSHISYEYIRYRDTVIQPAAFFRRTSVQGNKMDINLHYAFDWDFFIRISKEENVLPIKLLVAGYRRYSTTKTSSGGVNRSKELKEVVRRHLGRRSWQYGVISFFHRLYVMDDKLPGPLNNRLTPIIRTLSTLVYFLTLKKIIRV